MHVTALSPERQRQTIARQPQDGRIAAISIFLRITRMKPHHLSIAWVLQVEIDNNEWVLFSAPSTRAIDGQ